MRKIEKPFCFILTGAPGTGKTSVLEELKARGLKVFNEPAREILTDQLRTDGPALPSKNPRLFVSEMMDRSKSQLESALVENAPVFFDRGLPDVVVYAARFGVDGEAFEQSARLLTYNPTAFIFPPWQEIFVSDEVRKVTFEMTKEIHELQVQTYRRFGYELLEVPNGSVRERADFVLKKAKLLSQKS